MDCSKKTSGPGASAKTGFAKTGFAKTGFAKTATAAMTTGGVKKLVMDCSKIWETAKHSRVASIATVAIAKTGFAKTGFAKTGFAKTATAPMASGGVKKLLMDCSKKA